MKSKRVWIALTALLLLIIGIVAVYGDAIKEKLMADELSEQYLTRLLDANNEQDAIAFTALYIENTMNTEEAVGILAKMASDLGTGAYTFKTVGKYVRSQLAGAQATHWVESTYLASGNQDLLLPSLRRPRE